MKLSRQRLSQIKAAFEQRSGRKWADFFSKSSEIVLFGSWAVGRETAKSDLDILCVGNRRQARASKLDLLYYPEKFLITETWLTSELAIHIARYGVWLKGSGGWRQKVHITPETLAKKKEQVLIRFSRLECSLRFGPATIWAKEHFKLRRDLQRLAYLSAGKASPPSALLDDQWSTASADKKADLIELLRHTVQDLLLRSAAFVKSQP
jgi:predicted nucleotidyltransferase